MCIALPIIGAALGLAGSVANFAQQSAIAGAQQDYQEEIAERNRKLAQDAATQQYGAISERVLQENIRAETAAMRVQTDALSARGRVGAAAAEAGVSGNSVEALLGDFSRQEGNYIAAAKLNEEFARTQAEYEKQGVRTGLESRLVSSTPDYVPQPNLFGQALMAFSDSFNNYLQLS